MSAGWPYRCTGMIALVRGVIAASICAGSIVNDAGSMSTNTGRRAGVADRRDGRDERERHGDHFVARADAGGEQRQVQRAGAGVDGDRRGRPCSSARTRARTPPPRSPRTNCAALEDAGTAASISVLMRLVLRFEIEKRNHAAHLHCRIELDRRGRARRIDCAAASRMRTTRRPASPSVIGCWLGSMHSMKCLASV